VLHEVGHAIGFYHEQSRPDRDNFVTINYNNIEATKEFNFQSYSDTVINTYGIRYDYSSGMHYGSTVKYLSFIKALFNCFKIYLV
jgi:hypothetical protein